LHIWKEFGGAWGEHVTKNPRLDVSASGMKLIEEVVGSWPLLSGVTCLGFTLVGDLPFLGGLGFSMGWEDASMR
jgi:hypothetical protein